MRKFIQACLYLNTAFARYKNKHVSTLLGIRIPFCFAGGSICLFINDATFKNNC